MLFHGEMARYILKRGLFLCVLLLAVTVALVLRAKGGGPLAPRFYEYAAAFHFSAGVAFGCGLLGSALAEDIWRCGGSEETAGLSVPQKSQRLFWGIFFGKGVWKRPTKGGNTAGVKGGGGMLTIMELKAREDGGHGLQSQSHRTECWLEGWVAVPEELAEKVWSCGGYCEPVLEEGRLVDVVPGQRPEEAAPEPTAEERLRADVDFLAAVTGVEL